MKILVAEDDLVMSRLTIALLEKWGHETVYVSGGVEALETLKDSIDSPPGIALVDWVMPGMDGIELCKKVKKDREIPYFIYFILLTGRRSEADMVTGFEAGADDYIAKPIKKDELRSRLEVGVRTVEYERQLQESNLALAKYARIMESLAEEKAQQLIHAERLAMLGELSAGLAHEMNNYITPVRGYMDLLKLQIDSISSINDSEKADLLNSAEKAKIAAQRVGDLVERMRLQSRKSSKDKVKENVNVVIGKAAELCAGRLKYFDVQISLDDKLPEILMNPQELEQVFVNFFKNAADVLERNKGRINISSSHSDGKITVMIEDNGPGVPEEQRDKIFEAFFTTKDAERGTGLGLSVSRGIIESHGGEISLRESSLGGAAFIIQLPV